MGLSSNTLGGGRVMVERGREWLWLLVWRIMLRVC